MIRVSKRVAAAGGLAMAGLASATVLTLGGAAQAHTEYVVHTRGGALTVRDAPSTEARAIGTVSNRQRVQIQCQIRGSMVRDGVYTDTDLWNRIGPGRYVSDAYVSTGSTGMVAPPCPTNTRPSRSPALGLKDDYPAEYRGQSSGGDDWNFVKGNCTSFVAWRVNDRLNVPFDNHYRGPRWSHAKNWDDVARRVGVPVNDTPRVGAVAQWNGGPYGHVAWVSQVNNDGTITIEEYNYGGRHRYGTRTIRASSVDSYIHLDLG